MSRESSATDVVLIGSGISALTCAAILAKKGKSVRVLEQYSKPGGYLHCFSRFGSRFDTGAHYVGAMDPGQPFHTLLNYAGAYDPSLFIPLDPDGFDVLCFPDRRIELPKGYTETIERLAGAFPEERAAIEAYFRQVREVAAIFPTYEFSVDIDSEQLLWALETSLDTVVTRLTRNSALQCVLYSYCTLHGVRPSEVAFGLHALVVDSLVRGPYGLAQGGDGLARSFVAAIERGGGEVLLRKRVTKIETEGGVARAVITAEGERFAANWVVSAIHPKTTFNLVSTPEIFRPAFRERVARLPETAGVFGVYASCGQTPDLNPLKNYHYFSSTDPARLLDPPAGPEALPEAVFLSIAERTGGARSKLALNIHAMGPASWFESWRGSRYGKREASYEALKETYAERILDAIGRFQPGVRASIDRYATSTPLTNEHFNGSVEGSPYGIYHAIPYTGARALGPRTHVANLLLTGQSCLFPGLLGSAISGLRTAGHIVGIKPLLAELKERGERA